MRSSELECITNIATSIGNNADRLPTDPITGFMAMIGSEYAGNLMVVGRAVNGWKSGLTPERFNNAEALNEFVDNVLDSVTDNEICPMRWVTTHWGNDDHGYNTNKSAFWRVIRSVVEQLQITDIEQPEWPSYLIWSNIYKFAPEAKGNPSNRLCLIQQNECVNLLLKEITIYKPKKILFLTGIDWANPFLEEPELDLDIRNIQNRHYVEGMGALSLIKGQKISLVIA